jgi:biopolymer transport protein ExbD
MKVEVGKKRIASAALISFTDVIFLLLLFLLISSSFITHSGIKVNLPGSASVENEFNKNISLTLTADDLVYINDDPVEWDEISSELNKRLIDDPEQVVVVRADQDAVLKKIVRLLDLARQSGSNRFFLATDVRNRLADE